MTDVVVECIFSTNATKTSLSTLVKNDTKVESKNATAAPKSEKAEPKNGTKKEDKPAYAPSKHNSSHWDDLQSESDKGVINPPIAPKNATTAAVVVPTIEKAVEPVKL